MTLREFLVGELIDIIEWNDDTDDTMAWRFSRPKSEIKNGAQLIVRPGQMAILVDQGKLADVFQPGRHELTTANMPLLSTFRGWKYGFESPFKADVLFLATKQFVGRKWGTANPIILNDKDLGPVRLRAYGTYAVRVADGRRFVEEIVGATSLFTVDQIGDQVRDIVVAKVSGALAESNITVYDLSTKYDEVGASAQREIAGQVKQIGLEVAQLVIENVSLPPEVEATIDQKTRMNMLDNLDRYTRLQSADAIRDAARNPNGGAAAGIGIAMGAALGQRAGVGAAPPPLEPPPLPMTMWYYAVGSERRGPVEESALIGMGVLRPGTLVWKAGLSGWIAASSVPELARGIKQ
ncbi:MAG TPA: SPFH domain-containing protein [Gemmatimonadaceae bacterium]